MKDDLDRFARGASHAIAGPVATLGGFLEVIRQDLGSSGPIDAGLDDHLSHLERQVVLLRSISAAAGRYSQAGSARDPQPVPLAPLVDTAISVATESALDAARVTAGDLPVVWGDPDQLMVLFTELLSNAFRFQPPGERATVGIHHAGQRDGRERVLVSDDGIGIPFEYRSVVFEPFRRLHARDRYPGAGLGLATCRRIVDTMGGEIEIAQDDAAGTTVALLLPPPPP